MLNYLFTKTPLSFFVDNLWRDEAFSFVMASKPPIEIIQSTASDFNPPLYYLLLKIWMLFFGSSEIALRSLSLVFFLLTIYVIYLIMREILKISRINSFFYLVLFVFSPALNFYAFESRMYMMAIFLTTLSYYSYFKKKKILYIIAALLALYTHYFTIFIIFSQFLTTNFHILFNFIKSRRKVNLLQQINLKRNLQYIIVLSMFFPWLVYLLVQHNFFSSSTFWVVKPLPYDLIMLPFVSFTGYERVFGQYYHQAAGYINYHEALNMILLGLTAGISLLFIFTNFLQKGKFKTHASIEVAPVIFTWLCITPVILFIISLFATPIYHPRYFIIVSPAITLIIVIGLENLLFFINKGFLIFKINFKIAKFLVPIILILAFCTLFKDFFYSNLRYRSKTDVAPMYFEIAKLAKSEDYIYLNSELDFYLAKYYAPQIGLKIYGKTYESVPNYTGKVFMKEEDFTFVRPNYPSRAFLVSGKEYLIVSEM